MSTRAPTRPPAPAMALSPAAPPFWVGDPSILVFAVRYALGCPGGHVPEFARQAIEANAELLTGAARRVIVRDIRDWLGDGGTDAPAAARAVWVAALNALGVHG